ncbi:hypothetical protein TNIN_150201 [Trichonephila inaurata madagascariensis]|uniref:Uncharacterized protein n=1 Tax=Trichonephila inaurata madagascariensis TaxID=2747483 RepID=A0A8X7CRI8_9ARAC|nr:hypothetical protein TNIN_150201 [Trichonephila inaurata madagascariensis]
MFVFLQPDGLRLLTKGIGLMASRQEIPCSVLVEATPMVIVHCHTSSPGGSDCWCRYVQWKLQLYHCWNHQK